MNRWKIGNFQKVWKKTVLSNGDSGGGVWRGYYEEPQTKKGGKWNEGRKRKSNYLLQEGS